MLGTGLTKALTIVIIDTKAQLHNDLILKKNIKKLTFLLYAKYIPEKENHKPFFFPESHICQSQVEFRIQNCYHDVSFQTINPFFHSEVFSSSVKGKKKKKEHGKNLFSSQEDRDNRLSSVSSVPFSDVRLILLLHFQEQQRQ